MEEQTVEVRKEGGKDGEKKQSVRRKEKGHGRI
jgi:hypothetical protein